MKLSQSISYDVFTFKPVKFEIIKVQSRVSLRLALRTHSELYKAGQKVSMRPSQLTRMEKACESMRAFGKAGFSQRDLKFAYARITKGNPSPS